jgi:hypothetical protein
MPFEAGTRLGPYEIIAPFLLNTALDSASAPIVVSVNWMKKLAK